MHFEIQNEKTRRDQSRPTVGRQHECRRTPVAFSLNQHRQCRTIFQMDFGASTHAKKKTVWYRSSRSKKNFQKSLEFFPSNHFLTAETLFTNVPQHFFRLKKTDGCCSETYRINQCVRFADTLWDRSNRHGHAIAGACFDLQSRPCVIFRPLTGWSQSPCYQRDPPYCWSD